MKILIVDDHAVVRMGFRLLLESTAEMSVIAEADCGEAACQLYPELSPDVVVMDLAMPGMGGLEALRRIRARDGHAQVLALSAHDDPMHARRALQEGALGFLSKRSAPEALLEAVAVVAAGRRYLDPALAQKLALAEFDGGTKSPVERLSEREFARIESWPLDQRRAVLAELHSMRRLEYLVTELNRWLAQIPGSDSNPVSRILIPQTQVRET